MLAGREILTTVVIKSILPVTRVRLCLGSALRPLDSTPNPETKAGEDVSARPQTVIEFDILGSVIAR